jgi:uncharacterized protein (DUF885 family)
MLETIRTFSALSEEFVELSLKHHPVRATQAGLHDYDHLLPDDSPDGYSERATWLRDLEQRLMASVPWQELTAEHRVDYALLRSAIATERADVEEIRFHQKNPAIFPDTALRGIFLLTARAFAPIEDRKEAILDRLLAIPDYLKAARANLQQVPEPWLGIATEVNLAGPGFVDEVCRMLERQFPGEGERIEHAGSRARQGFFQYQQFIENELEPRVGGTFAIGERWMNHRLERTHMLTMDCAAVEALGREHVAHTLQALADEAGRIDPARGWKDLIADGRLRHPEVTRVREAYAAEAERARRFVADRKIVPIPEGEKLVVADTPLFQRAVVPMASYMAPAPFDEDRTGHLFVTPVDGTRRKEDQQQQLQQHSYAELALVTVHETFPGHHVQQLHARHAGSRLRRLCESPLLVEGWALYCEELMHEQGFYLDPLTRLFQLRDLLWRACRVVVDVGLQRGTLTFMQAVDYLVETAMVERVNAVSEVRRYTMTPTQPLAYLIGKLELLALRDEARRRLGPAFDLSEFHARLLGLGSLPPALLREELLPALENR